MKGKQLPLKSVGHFYKNQQGYVLISTYFLMTAAAIISLANCMHSANFMHECERQRNAIVALEMAESGLDNALVTLKTNSSYAGTTTASPVSMSFGTSRGAYDTVITTPAGASSNVRKVVVQGHSPDAAAVNSPTTNAENLSYKLATTNAYIQIPVTNYFAVAMFAASSYSNSGNGTTDSFQSGSGAYAAGSARSNGSVGTNSTANGTVTLSGNAIVKGNVSIGAGGNTAAVIATSGNAAITGSKSAQTTNTTLTTPTASGSSSGALSISGNSTVTLAAGTYNYSSISISGNGRLVTSGAVTLYVTGAVSISGNGTASYQNKPKNLTIYATTSAAVSVTGNGNTYAAIYAPLSTITISGNGSVYGAVVGNAISMSGNANFHYDEDLSSISSGTSAAAVLTWIQKGNSNWTT